MYETRSLDIYQQTVPTVTFAYDWFAIGTTCMKVFENAHLIYILTCQSNRN